MGFATQARNAGVTFFSMTHGKVRIRIQSPCEGSTERQLKDGNVVHELVHDTYEGRLVSLTKEDSQWGVQWRFEFDDEGTRAVCTMNYDSVNAQRLLNVFLSPDLDITHPVILKPYDFISKEGKNAGKQVAGITVYQGGEKIQPAFATASYPVEGRINMPELKAGKYRGKDAWDSTERLEFLEKHIEDFLLPRLSAIGSVNQIASVPPVNETDGDGLPF